MLRVMLSLPFKNKNSQAAACESEQRKKEHEWTVPRKGTDKQIDLLALSKEEKKHKKRQPKLPFDVCHSIDSLEDDEKDRLLPFTLPTQAEPLTV